MCSIMQGAATVDGDPEVIATRCFMLARTALEVMEANGFAFDEDDDADAWKK